MKKINFNKFSFLKTTAALVTAAACTFSILAQQAFALSPLAPLRIQDGKLLDSYGKPFIFRGITIDHTLAPDKTLQALKDIAAAGANSAQIEFNLVPKTFAEWPPTSVLELEKIIAACKENKLICVLEPNDVAGWPVYGGENGGSIASWWPTLMRSILTGHQDHIIVGFGNQHFVTQEFPREFESRMYTYLGDLFAGLPAGYLVMIDGDNWSEDTTKSAFNFAKELKSSGHSFANRLIYSVDMFYSYQDPTRVREYIANFSALEAPLVIGGFGPAPYYHPHRPKPLNLDAPQIPITSIMQYAEEFGVGYFGWSWSGNENPFLDIVANYDASAVTNWGSVLLNDVNGIKATSRLASIYGNVSSSSTSKSSSSTTSSASSISSLSSASSVSSISSVSSTSSISSAFSSAQVNRPPIVDFFVSNYPSIFCGSPNAGQGKITATATGTYDPDGDPLTYLWSGPGGTATGETATFKSWSGYSYQVTLTVTDSHGASATGVRSVSPFYLDCPFSSSSSITSSRSSSIVSSRSSSISSSVKSSSVSSSSSRISSSSSRISSSSSAPNNGKAQCSYQIQSQWGNGFNAAIRIKNVGAQPINGWSVNWQYTDGSKVTNLWNANLSGSNPYTAKNLNWNTIIQPGQTIEFGFQGIKSAGTVVAPKVTGAICE